MLVRNGYGFLLGGLAWLGVASAQPTMVGSKFGIAPAPPPLCNRVFSLAWASEVQRTLIGGSTDERVCYLETVVVRGRCLELYCAALKRHHQGGASSWAFGGSRGRPSGCAWDKLVLLHGHAEPTEISASTCEPSSLSCSVRAGVARTLLIEHGIQIERIKVYAHGSYGISAPSGEPIAQPTGGASAAN